MVNLKICCIPPFSKIFHRTVSFLITLFFLIPAVWAGVPLKNEIITLDEVSFGTLLLKLGEDTKEHVRAPLLSSSYEMEVSGTVVRTTLTQSFLNPTTFWLEGLYAFPLPNGSAIDGLRMRVGDRLIEGKIKEKKEARRIYKIAKGKGKKTALLVQHRPNLFTNSVANIGPNETIIVQISYQQLIKPDLEVYTLRAPMVSAPRYEPETIVQRMKDGPNGWQPIDRNSASLLTNRAIRKPDTTGPKLPHNPVKITVRLSAGFPLGEIYSSSHSIHVERKEEGVAKISLKSVAPSDRDFILTWVAQNFEQPKFYLFKETLSKKTYYLAMLTPPKARKRKRPKSRNIIFVQDVSGSMSGESIEQARSGLQIALNTLKPHDWFNIIFFNDNLWSLSERFLPAKPNNIHWAKYSVKNMSAKGGTEMLPAIEKAMRLGQNYNNGRLTQIVFITDGAISNEEKMMRAIHSGLGKSRLFTVGIGSAPNSYFMNAAAMIGKGNTIYINDLEAVSDQMDRLFTKLENPVLTDLKVVLPGNARALTPSPLPDLYVGEPVVFAFIIEGKASGRVGITSNTQRTNSVRLTFDLAKALERPGIAKLWARKQISNLERFRNSSFVDTISIGKLDAKILSTALRYNLVSSQTSLVAVDVTPARGHKQPLHSKQIANNLPKGWDPKVFFKQNKIYSSNLKHVFLSPLAIDRLRSVASFPSPQKGISLPKTALNWFLPFSFGLFLLVIGTGLWIVIARSRNCCRGKLNK